MTKKIFTLFMLATFALLSTAEAQHSVARIWNERQLKTIRKDFGRPTVQARNLFHVSIAMYDAWAVYDDEAETFLLGKTVGNFTSSFDGVPAPSNLQAARDEAISYAAYRVLVHRYQHAPPANVVAILDSLYHQMLQLEYDPDITSTDYSTGSPAALGNYIGSQVIAFGQQDGANEPSYANQYYEVVNQPLVVKLPGNPNMVDPNRWQEVSLDVFVDQNGNPIPFNTPPFLSPEWGNVTPFALKQDSLTIFERDGNQYKVYHDPGTPPLLDSTLSEEYKWTFELVAIWSGQLAPFDSVMWDISPAGIGNNQSYPTAFEDYHDFYDLYGGGDNSPGHSINPKTGQPYAPQMVPRGDYARVLAEFWADGPNSETPPGHWYTILNYVMDHPDFQRRFKGQGPILDDLEWDVKSYLALGGALHDVAVTVWGIKGWYDYVRPVSAIRYMAEKGQSSDPGLPHYHPHGVRLQPGYIELVEPGDPLAGPNGENVDKIKIYAWYGPDSVSVPATDVGGVGWMLAEKWWPYQRPTFVTPPFAGYLSGHSSFSRTAAEVLTELTGDPFFPGGMGVFPCTQNQFLVFEDGPSVDVMLQWATYRDASDQCSLSRIWGGIHPPADDIKGRHLGMILGPQAVKYAEALFYNDLDEDGSYSYLDCDDTNASIHPGASELCDGLDNNCDGFIDENLTINTYYVDLDGDGFGDAATALDTCLASAPVGYVDNATDCDDTNNELNPGVAEICDDIDNDCNGTADDGLPINTYYLDQDGDSYGGDETFLTSCEATAPAGFASNNLDCDDENASLNPDQEEVCDGLDNDCNGTADDGLLVFMYFQDLDGDSFGDANIPLSTCESDPPSGFVFNDVDCDDTNAAIHPNAEEVMDNLDNDCNGLVDDLNSVNDISRVGFKLFPNPVHDALSIESAFQGQLTMEMFRVDGTSVRSQQLDFNNQLIVISLENVPQGVYWIQLTDTTGKQRFVSKVVRI